MLTMLEVKNLYVEVADVPDSSIIKGLNLRVNKGEVHAIMGPNGSGKSTLANVIAGRPDYKVTAGDIVFNDESIIDSTPDERAHRGIFLASQYPSEIPGVRPWQFLKAATDSIRTANGKPKMSVREFSSLFQSVASELEFSSEMMKRSLNSGFSGGEKKRNEILQMAILEPKLVIMDETDSGLDVDALRTVSNVVNRLRSPDRAFIIVTHYSRIFKHISPDVVHVFSDGQIIKTGSKDLAMQIEDKGYESIASAIYQ